MQLWLNAMTKESITPQELAQIKGEQEFNNLLRTSRMPVKNVRKKCQTKYRQISKQTKIISSQNQK
jgi:hypothetical protein